MKNTSNNSIEELEIYLLAKELAIDIYNLSQDFPKEEKFGITSQLRKAICSVGANIEKRSTNLE